MWRCGDVMPELVPAAAVCEGQDPAYPDLRCYMLRGHADDCEFTDAIGMIWRARALAAESLVRDWRAWFTMDTPEGWRHPVQYAIVALEGSSDNGDRFCAQQLEALLHVKDTEDA
jgi:hypothetical protein